MATDLVLVEPEADVDRVEWAKQLVGNAVRSPYIRQAIHRRPDGGSNLPAELIAFCLR